MLQKLLAWFDDRTGYRTVLNKTLYEPIPGGARWRYAWGSTLIFTFILQIITGTCLWMSYSPSATTAWESVFYIQHETTFGWLIRGIHHFTAGAMIILMVCHMMQIMIDGAYKAPREINFWLGLILMQIVMVMGVTGYLLPWDQKGYSATQVVTGIIGSTPFIGPYIQTLAQGGTQYGTLNLTRFFALHAGILPGCMAIVLCLHLFVFKRHGRTAIVKPGRADAAYWPDQFLRDAVACMIVLIAVMATTFYWRGAELSAPADPSEPYSIARPEWYYLFLFKFLSIPWVAKFGADSGLGESFGAVIVPGLVVLIIALAPFIARIRYGHLINNAFLWSVVGIAAVLTGAAVHSDWLADTQEGRDFRDGVKLAHRDYTRVTELAHSPTGIPPSGAAGLLRNDPLTQGPKLFETYCAACHQPEGTRFNFDGPAVAPALAAIEPREEIIFGSRAWIRESLLHFEKQFQSLNNTEGDYAEAANAIVDGSMKDWSENNGPILEEEDNAPDLQALIEFLYTQSGRHDSLQPDHPDVIRGQKIFETGTLTSGEIDACIDCHSMKIVELVDGKRRLSNEALSEGLFPDLTEYASTAWLKRMISHPEQVYSGESGNNAMPGFYNQLTETELDLLARWLSLNYHGAQASK